MEYTVKKLASLAGVSARTLRHYDAIGLLRPKRISSSGYRIYGRNEVDLLQQILFYREMEVPLQQIGEILSKDNFNKLDALKGHYKALVEKKERLEQLIDTVSSSIYAQERDIVMDDKEKFEGFKRAMIEENEDRYGCEIREKYGDQTIDAANARRMQMSTHDYNEMERLGKRILELLDIAFEYGDVKSTDAQELARLHKEWLCYSWEHYSAEAHAGLVEMYVQDERFSVYYDRGINGKAQFLRDAVLYFLEQQNTRGK